jgi:4-diphosphocytidyl-2-C-methyl-D-erythritol kinase
MDNLRVYAYAKLNLTLRLVGRRADGYHELQSLVTAVDFADRITLTPAEQGIALVAPADLGPPERNLALRAARALLLGEQPGVRIELEKGIPAGAGLGGGSSDAAAVLVGLNELFSLGKSLGELQGIGAGLGADVPFFLGPSPAWIEGIGEKITPVDVALPAAFLVLVPRFHCPTPEVYRAFDGLHLPLSPPWLGGAAREDMTFTNDLWPAAVHLYPELHRVRDLLSNVARGVVAMTGSGSALFAPFPSRVEAEDAADRLRSRFTGEIFVASPSAWGYRIQR